MAAVLTARFDFTQPQAAAKKTAKEVKALEQAAKGTQGALDNTARSAKGAGGAAALFGKAAKGAAPGVNALGAALKSALGPIAVLTTAAGALTSAFSTLAQQDFAEAKVRTLGVDSDELTKRLSGVSRELAGQASIVELTASAYDVASAGFNDAASAAQVLKASSLAATGGFSDLNTVADATTSVLNAYGLGAEEASRITDQFIQTQNDGKIVIGQYAANIAKVAPVASALGIGLDEINAAVAQITGTGTNAEVTFTALKTAFAQLASGAVGEKLKEFGVNIDANTIAADGFIGTLEKIKKSGADTGAILKAFGTEAGPVLQPLLNNTDKLNKLLENQKNSQGAAAKAAFEASDTINGALKRLQTAFTNLFADGSELGLLLKQAFKAVAVQVELIGAALKLVLAPIRGLIAGVQAFFKELAPFGENINLAYEFEKAFQAFMGTVSFATDVVTGLFTVIGQGVATHIGNVLNLAASIRDGVVSVFSGLAETIKSTMAALYDNLPRPIQFIIEQAGKGFQAVQGFLGKAVSGVAEKVSGAVVELAAVGGGVQQQPGAQPAAANSIQETNGALTAAVDKGKPKKEKAPKKTELERQQEDAAKLIKQLERKNELDALGTDEARKLKELEFAKLDIAERFPELKSEEIEAIQGLLQENYNITEEKRKQKELDEKAAADARKLEEFYANVGSTIQAGIVDGIQSAIDGSKSLKESLSGILKQLGGMFLNAGIGGLGKSMGIPGFNAEGAYASGATNTVVGEAGPEYIIPESKMRESMARYARGARGSAVIPENGEGGTNSEGGGVSASTLDVRFNVERINSVDYVTASEFQAGMRQAAAQGAQRGQQAALKRLQQSPSTRRRVGI